MSPDHEEHWGAYQLLTSPGPAAIAVIRVRGPRVEGILARHLRSRTRVSPAAGTAGQVFRAELLDANGEAIDDVLVSVHAPGPNWDLRLHLHGSPGVVRCCEEILRQGGLQSVSESLSTLWHCENRIDAEAHALLPSVLTLDGVRWLSEQTRRLPAGVRWVAEMTDVDAGRRACREIAARREILDRFVWPLRVALVGPPNAGKSTLVNTLADQHVSLVSPLPGTTRDWIEVPGEVAGFPVLWLDTAGLRRDGDQVEAEGIRRTRALMDSADAILLVLDGRAAAAEARAEFCAAHAGLHPACIAANHADQLEAGADPAADLPAEWRERTVRVSAAARTGIDELTARLLRSVGYEAYDRAAPAAFTDRQVDALTVAAGSARASFREHVLACL